MQKCKKKQNKNRYAPYIFIYIVFYCFSPYSCFWQKKKTQEQQYNIIYYLSLVPRLNPFCSLFSLSCPFNNASTLRDLREGDEENVQINLCLLSLLQYKKPKEILTLEQELLKELKKLKGTGEGDADCKMQWILTVGARGTVCVASQTELSRVIFLSPLSSLRSMPSLARPLADGKTLLIGAHLT